MPLQGGEIVGRLGDLALAVERDPLLLTHEQGIQLPALHLVQPRPGYGDEIAGLLELPLGRQAPGQRQHDPRIERLDVRRNGCRQPLDRVLVAVRPQEVATGIQDVGGADRIAALQGAVERLDLATLVEQPFARPAIQLVHLRG